MTDPKLSPAARAALDAYAEATDEAMAPARTAALIRSALGARQRARRQFAVQLAAFAAACIVGAVAYTGWRGPPARAPAEEIHAVGPARWQWKGELVQLAAGTVRISPRPGRTVRVATPELDAALVHGAVATFTLDETGTRFSVETGEVTWRAGARSGRAVPGEAVALANAVPALKVAARGPRFEGCAGEAPYEACLDSVAHDGGLAAETALFELGTLAHHRADFPAAIVHFRAYVTRFPEGVFAPEASIALMLALRRTGDAPGAAEEAGRFLARHPADPRAEQVRALEALVNPQELRP